MQRSPPILLLGCRISAVFDEEPGHVHMTPGRRPMQRGRPIFPPGCGVGAMLDEEAGHIHMTPLGRTM